MHFNIGTVAIGTALAAALYLFLNKNDRMFPTIAVIAAGIELLLAMGLMSLSLNSFRIDVILPALLVVSGAICWARSSEKGSITAATVLTMISGVQLAVALHLS
jgi:uncharacterized membrane protein YqgA involved in biofilm formation